MQADGKKRIIEKVTTVFPEFKKLLSPIREETSRPLEQSKFAKSKLNIPPLKIDSIVKSLAKKGLPHGGFHLPIKKCEKIESSGSSNNPKNMKTKVGNHEAKPSQFLNVQTGK